MDTLARNSDAFIWGYEVDKADKADKENNANKAEQWLKRIT